MLRDKYKVNTILNIIIIIIILTRLSRSLIIFFTRGLVVQSRTKSTHARRSNGLGSSILRNLRSRCTRSFQISFGQLDPRWPVIFSVRILNIHPYFMSIKITFNTKTLLNYLYWIKLKRGCRWKCRTYFFNKQCQNIVVNCI